jgi:hypothetical protein
LFKPWTGAGPGFKVRGDALKKFGYFVWKITILRKKIIFIPILGGAPPGSAPAWPLYKTAKTHIQQTRRSWCNFFVEFHLQLWFCRNHCYCSNNCTFSLLYAKWNENKVYRPTRQNRSEITVGSINYWKYCSITEPPRQ